MELNDQTIVLRCITSIYTIVFLVWMLCNITKPAGLEKTIGFVVGIAMIMVLHLGTHNYIFVLLWSIPLLLWLNQLIEDAVYSWDSRVSAMIMIVIGLNWFMVGTLLLVFHGQLNWVSFGYIPFLVVGYTILVIESN